VRGLVARRREQRAGGRRQFAPLYVVLDEAQDIMHQVDGARELYETLLRRGGKLGIHLIVGVHDRQVGTMKLEGASHLLINFGHVAHVRYVDGRRVADVETSEGTQRMPVPVLPDLDTLITPPEDKHDELLHDLLYGIGTSQNQARPPITSDHQFSPVITSDHQQNGPETPVITSDEIRRMIAAGQSKNQVAVHLKGSRKERLATINRALAEGDAPPGAFGFLSE
jgi:hypothetical protein